MLGSLGHLSIIIAFVSIAWGAGAYFMAQQSLPIENRKSWLNYGRLAFLLHGIAVLSTIVCLFGIIAFRHYEYQYAWKHASNSLPLQFIISCFWEGQEGSFLLWMFWNVLVGAVLIRFSKSWESSAMAIFCALQLFLSSMVLGVHLGDFQIGSSPFLLLKDVIKSDIFLINPDFVPKDGTGLNPLLQNIWMVIHPPVIFLGFALSALPFVLALSALWQNKVTDFVDKASPWLLISAGALGLGMIMGAYWAYETLNFGGYWNWDPVENAILIPWLVQLAAIHGTILFKRKGKGLSLTLGLAIVSYILVVYSTFLTRSGILGNSSVHAFTDLGLSSQLVFFLLFAIAIAIVAFVWRRKSLLTQESEAAVLSSEFWLFLGIIVFGLSAFQVLLPTSLPVVNVILQGIGIDGNFAPPVDAVGFYSKFQLWFAVTFCLVAAIGQLLYWKKSESWKSLVNFSFGSVTATLLFSSLIIWIGKTSDIRYICLITSAVWVLVVSIQLLVELLRQANRTSLGGFLAHAGMAVMLLGFVYSAGHQKMISHNIAINKPDSSLPIHTVQENLLLNRNIPKANNGYTLTYVNKYYEAQTGGFMSADEVISTPFPGKKIWNGNSEETSLDRTQGDTLEINVENTFYHLDITTPAGNQLSVTPRIQNNPTMGYIASPDISSFWHGDLYTHITNFPDPEKVKWDEPQKFSIKENETLHFQGLAFTLEDVVINEKPAGIPILDHEVALEAQVSIKDEHQNYRALPIFHVNGARKIRLYPDEIEALGVSVALSKVNPVSKEYELTLRTSQRDWVTVKSIEMPMIGLVWLGAILLLSGIGIAAYFRLVSISSAKALKVESGEPLVNKKLVITIGNSVGS